MASKKEEKKQRHFEIKGVKYLVRKPNMQELTNANRKHREVFNEEISVGSLLRSQLDEELRKRQLWSDDREARYQRLKKEIIDNEYALSKGGIKLSDAKQLAFEMQDKRNEMVEMLSARSELDTNTCEGRADAIRFNFLFSCCLVYEDSGAPYFEGGLDEYLENQDDEVAERGASEFFYLMSNTDEAESSLPENAFLQKFSFANKDDKLVDKDGRLVDRDGKHIDDDGNFIKWLSDTESVKVDLEGRPIDDSNNFIVESVPFLDDDGNPIESVAEDKPKKRTRKKPTESMEDLMPS
jgi:hypothetical protein